jgi:hypothetical protein
MTIGGAGGALGIDDVAAVLQAANPTAAGNSKLQVGRNERRGDTACMSYWSPDGEVARQWWRNG